MSVASTSTSTSSGSVAKVSTDELVAKLHRRLGHENELSCSHHVAAGRICVQLRDRLLQGDFPSQRARITLLCAGVAVHRRACIDELADTALVHRSATLIFALLCLCDAKRSDDGAQRAVAQAQATSLWDAVRASRKRPREDTDAEPTPERSASKEGELAKHALSVGKCALHGGFDALKEAASLFFRAAASNLRERLLQTDGDGDFVSLACQPILSGSARAEKLLSIVQAGESEAGQSIIRDMLLSFLLPRSHAGVRRTLLLTRAATTNAGVDYPDEVARAHAVAMAGAEYMWEHATDELERACCLLAGVAVLTTKGTDDPLRKCDAFGGRLQLPFFETAPPAATDLRITLLPSSPARYALYSLSAKGTPNVRCVLPGFEGLEECVIQLVGCVT